MRGGNFNRMITIQSRVQTQLPSGEPIVSWENVILRRPAQRRDVIGSERNLPAEKVAYDQVKFRIRSSDDVADVSPNYRVIYPALTQAEVNDEDFEVENRRVYDVLAVAEVEDGVGLELLTQRRSDVTP